MSYDEKNFLPMSTYPAPTLEPLDPFGDHGSGVQKESDSSNELSSESLETPDNSDELFA